MLLLVWNHDYSLSAIKNLGLISRSVGKEHFWISIVVSSLSKGALADCFKRFPWVSTAVQTLFSGFIKKLLEDTRKHEAYSMELIQRCGAFP